MALGKQAKVLNNNQQKTVLNYLATTRSPLRNKVIFLLSVKSGLRAKEISQLKWSMVTTSDGELSDCISLTNKASKGNSGGVMKWSCLFGQFGSEVKVYPVIIYAASSCVL